MTQRVKDQIYQGTQAVYSADGFGDQMRVRAMVVIDADTESNDGPELIRSAVNKYFTDEAAPNNRRFSPGHAGLPVQRITGRQVARNLVELQIDYAGRSVVGDGTTLASFQMITMPTVIFTKAKDSGDDGEGTFKNGLPFGLMIDGSSVTSQFTSEEVTDLRTRSFPRSAMRISVDRVNFGLNPMREFGSFMRTVSKNSNTIAGFPCAPGTLMLEGLQSTATTFGTIDPAGQTPADQLRYEYKLSLVYDHNGFPVQGFEKVEDGHVLDVAPEFKPANWRL